MSRTRATIAFDLHNMVPGPTGVGNVQVINKSEDGIILCYGITKPTGAGYAKGCIFIHTDGSAGTMVYVNDGSKTSADFEVLGTPNNVDVLMADGSNIEDAIETAYPLSGSAAGVGPSPEIWDDAPVLDVVLDPTLGFYVFEDFATYGGLSLSSTGSDTGLTFTKRTNGTLANNPAIPGGIMVLDSAVITADEGGTLQMLGLQCEPANGTTIYMEWRCKVAENGGQVFMGLCDDSMTAPVDSNDAIVLNNLAGFYRDTTTGDTDWTAGCADGASKDEDDDIATSSATAYNKYGIVISGIGAVSGSTIKYYFNGALVYTTTNTAHIPLLLMCPCFQMDGDDSDRMIMSLDWVRVLVHHASGTCRES